MLKLFDYPFLGRGFRPFFFMGALYSVISLALWGGFFVGYVTPPDFFLDFISWHAHEMLYGFTMAIVAGFLLTAVANWTGGAPARQVHLAGLCLLWLLGRVVINFDMGLPVWVLIAVEVSFIPALAITLAIPLVKSRNKRNFIFLTLLSVLFACDLWFMMTSNKTPIYIALMMIIAMVSLIGGRVIPAFTVAALRQKGVQAFQTPQMSLDIAALVSLVVTVLALVFASGTLVLSACAGVAALIHALRMRRYHSLETFGDPMLWILHAGYAWLVIGLFLLSLTGYGVFEVRMVIHALTAGCIGSMTLGMMCRVTLGHTGRKLEASAMTVVAFYMMQVAAIIRVFGPILKPGDMMDFVVVSAALWTACFVIYLFVYTPMLFSERPDGSAA